MPSYSASAGGEGASKKRKRTTKDPHAPKRALSAFFCFSQAKRPEVNQAHPEWKVGQVAKELGRQWQELNPEQKKQYEGMSLRDKSRYEAEMLKYKAGNTKAPAARGKAGGGGASSSAPHDDDDDDDDDDGDD